MRAMLFGLGLMACLATTGCYQKEQAQTQAYEDHLKATLGTVGRVGEPEMARVKVADVGHAASAQ